MAINDPRDIPGLLLWYSAEAETGYTDGQVMSGWTDLSGNGRHAVGGGTPGPTWRATAGAGGRPAVLFATAAAANKAHFSVPSAVVSGLTSGEIVASLRATVPDGGGRKWQFGTGAEDYPYQGYNYSSFGRASAFSGPLAGDPQLWARIGAWSAANDGAMTRNGVSFFTPASNAVAWNSTIQISSSIWAFAGYIGAVVLYSRKLTTTERADLEAWFAANPSGGTAGALTPSITLAGTAAAASAAFTVTHTPSPRDITLAGTAAGATAALSLNVPTSEVPSVTLAGSAPAASASFALTSASGYVETSTEFANDGYNYDGTAAVYFEPPIAESPNPRFRKIVKRVHQSMPPPNLVNGRPT